MKYLLSFVPVALAAVFLVLKGLGYAQASQYGGLTDALVVASGLLAFAYLSSRLFAGERLEQMEDAARQMRDAMGDADALRKVVQRFMLLQQTASENLAKLQEGAVAAASRVEGIDASRMREISAAAKQAVHAAERAAEAEKTMMEQLLDAHCAVWMNASSGDSLVSQLALQLEVPLQRAGIHIIAETGVQLDGEQHERVDDEPVDEAQSGQVVHVYKPGYVKGGRIVRRARVRVGTIAKTDSQPDAETSEATRTSLAGDEREEKAQ
jgi:molecular chaperone GrpE (heat shock protein)